MDPKAPKLKLDSYKPFLVQLSGDPELNPFSEAELIQSFEQLLGGVSAVFGVALGEGFSASSLELSRLRSVPHSELQTHEPLDRTASFVNKLS